MWFTIAPAWVACKPSKTNVHAEWRQGRCRGVTRVSEGMAVPIEGLSVSPLRLDFSAAAGVGAAAQAVSVTLPAGTAGPWR